MAAAHETGFAGDGDCREAQWPQHQGLWSSVDVEEPHELRPLPPDPLGSGPFGEDEEPAWLDSWLASVGEGRESGEGQAPDHLPSEMLAATEPGLFLAAELEGTDPREVDDYHLVEVIAGYHRLAAWAQWRMTELAGHLSRRPALNPTGTLPTGQYVLNVTADELAPRLGISRFAARRVVDNAQLFALKLEDTGTALREGRIDYAKACAVARLLKDQPPDVAWEVQQVVLPDASHQTITQLERAIAKAIISIDPHRATARHKAAREQRRVHHPRPLPDGMASIFAVLPATDAAGLDLALEAAARAARAAGDSRTIEQLRADALALLGHGALEHGFIGMPREQVGAEGARATSSSRETSGGAEERDGDDAAAGAPAGDGSQGTPAGEGDGDDGAAGTSAGGGDDGAAGAAGTPAGDGDGSHGTPPGDGEAPDDDGEPVLQTGNAFLRTPHVPIGRIGGRRAQIKVIVPLSVLVPPDLFGDAHGCQGESSAHGHPPAPGSSSSGGESGTQTPGAAPGCGDRSPPDAAGPPEDEGLPQDWYYGPPVEVAELDGYGPITPDVARALAFSGGTWQRLVTDPLSGELLDVGRTRYRPPAHIADFVRHRDGTCVRPGCSSPASVSQLDHIVPWEFGGVTSAENLGPMCGSDHPAKTVGACGLRHLGGGNFQWTSPSGHQYLRHHSGRITLLRRGSRARDHEPSGFGDEPPF